MAHNFRVKDVVRMRSSGTEWTVILLDDPSNFLVENNKTKHRMWAKPSHFVRVKGAGKRRNPSTTTIRSYLNDTVDGIDKDHYSYRTRAQKKVAVRYAYEEALLQFPSKAAGKRALGGVSSWYDGLGPGIEDEPRRRRNPHPPENWWWTMSSEEYGPEVFGPYDSYDDADDGITRVRKKVWALQDDIARWYSEPVSGPKPEAPFDTLGMDPFELEDDGRVPNPKRSNPSKAPLYHYSVTGPQGGKYLTSTMAEARKLTKNGGTIKKLKKPRKG